MQPLDFEHRVLRGRVSKEDYERALSDLRVGLVNAQFDLRQADFPLVVLVHGNDRAGVREALDALAEWMDQRHVRVHFFGALTSEEKRRPRAWRYWSALPRHGQTAIFVGAWARTLVEERVARTIDRPTFDRLCARVRTHETELADDGALLVKLWLQLPKRALEQRIAKRAGRRSKRDAHDEAALDAYRATARTLDDFLRATDTPRTPWTLIDSSDREFANLTVARTILARLQAHLAERSAAQQSTALVPATPALARATPRASTKRTGTPAPASVLAAVDLSLAIPDERYEFALAQNVERLAHLTRRARKRGVATVLVFEGWDAAGKGGTIRRLSRAIELSDYEIVSIAAPSEEERAHHYLWRFWTRVPPDGKVLLFDRSWYGRVLVERVEGFASEAQWRRAYDEIVDFEEQLIEHGTVLCKFWLHISHDEQMRRFRARESTAYKKYKITAEDYRNRARRPEYETAVSDMVERTHSDAAPWHLVPAQDKRWARIQVFETVCAALEARL